jgi:general secretion pathway protein H
VTFRRVDLARRAGGFTLLEMLVVIAIMAALAAAFPLALSRFVPARRVDAAARQLLGDIRVAEARSLSTGRPVEIVPAANGYVVKEVGGSMVKPVSTRTWRTSTALSLKSRNGSRDLPVFRIFPDGSSSGAYFWIRDGERVRAVVVSELTSHVHIETGP